MKNLNRLITRPNGLLTVQSRNRDRDHRPQAIKAAGWPSGFAICAAFVFLLTAAPGGGMIGQQQKEHSMKLRSWGAIVAVVLTVSGERSPQAAPLHRGTARSVPLRQTGCGDRSAEKSWIVV